MALLPDVHAQTDGRGLALTEVGVRGVAVRLDASVGSEATGPVTGTATLYASLRAEQRGGHLSRFGEALQSLGGRLAFHQLPGLLTDVARRLEAEAAGVRIDFPLYLERTAPVSGARSGVRFDCALGGTLSQGAITCFQEVAVVVQTVCPCSKEISARGAHNQRCRVLLAVHSQEGLPFSELIALGEGAGSGQVYSLLKRTDEKALTEQAYDHPAFVEDVVRHAAAALGKRAGVQRYAVEAQSQESIHPHDAYARAEGRPQKP